MYWTHVLSMFFSIFTASGFLMRRAKIILRKLGQNAKLEGLSSEERELISTVQQYYRSVSWFVVTAGVLLTCGYIILYLFQEEIIGLLDIPEILYSSGLMTLCLLFLISVMIRLFYSVISKFLKLDSVKPDEAKSIIFILSVLLNLCFFLFDPGTGIYVSVLILGKLIWIDSIYDFDSLKQTVSEQIREYNESDLTSGEISLQYAKMILICFCFGEAVWLLITPMNVTDLIDQLGLILPIYVILGSMLSTLNTSMEKVYGMDTLKKTGEYLSRQQKKR